MIVVLNKRGLNSTYREKSHDRMVVSRELLEIERETPIDALVYTLDEWSAFLMQDSAFAKLIRQKGVVLMKPSTQEWLNRYSRARRTRFKTIDSKSAQTDDNERLEKLA